MNEQSKLFIELIASKIDWELMEKANPNLYDDPVIKYIKDITDEKNND
tara:strand:- start:385 stop:528 length:144 start_codon:yes stop_codon:yes gene_type:complete